MDKPPRRRSHDSLSLTKEQILSTSNVVRDAFRKLVSKGVDESDLAKYLCLIPSLPGKLPLMVPGKTDRTTRNFPKRIESLAEEIEAVSSKGGLLYYITRDAWSEAHPPNTGTESLHPAKVDEAWLTQGSYRRTLDDFRKLPRLLRAYAAYLKSAIGQREPRDDFQKFVVIKLLEMVRRTTGKFYFAEVGDLCEAAFQAVECDPPRYLRTLESFEKIYRNNPRLHAPPNKGQTGK